MQAVNHREICNHGRRAAWVLLSKESTGAKAELVSSAASFLCTQSSTGDPEVPSCAGITRLAPAHSLSAELNSAKALGCLPFSPHLQQWGGEMELSGSGELRAPCGKCRCSTPGAAEAAVAGRNPAHVPSAHIRIPGVPRPPCSPVCRDTEYLTCLIGITYL